MAYLPRKLSTNPLRTKLWDNSTGDSSIKLRLIAKNMKSDYVVQHLPQIWPRLQRPTRPLNPASTLPEPLNV